GLLCVLQVLASVCVFFFFQAEDGIRDWSVTGVQTCALPISPGEVDAPPTSFEGLPLHFLFRPLIAGSHFTRRSQSDVDPEVSRRSEERRVGKEGRSRRSAYH